MSIDRQTEKNRIESTSSNWSSLDAEFAHVINHTYLTLKPYFKGSSCLELGSADGGMTQFLVDDFQEVVSVDGSESFVSRLKERNIPNLTAITSFFEDLSLDQEFDTVILSHILEHVDNPVEILKIAKRYTKKGGVILIDVPNADSFHRLIGVEMGMLPQKDALNETDVKLGHRRVYTVDLMKEHIRLSGMKLQHWGGHFLKVLSAGQMKDFSPQLMDAFYNVGRYTPLHAAEIYFVCTH